MKINYFLTILNYFNLLPTQLNATNGVKVNIVAHKFINFVGKLIIIVFVNKVVYSKEKRRNKNMKKQNKKGFTLVELLVVIAILAILATVSVVGYSQFTEKAKKSNDETELHQIALIVEA